MSIVFLVTWTVTLLLNARVRSRSEYLLQKCYKKFRKSLAASVRIWVDQINPKPYIMNDNYRGSFPLWVRHTSLLMCAVFIHVNIVYGALEPAKSFWAERKKAAASLTEHHEPSAPEPALIASLPSDFLPQVSHPTEAMVPMPGISPALKKPEIKIPGGTLPK